MIEWVVSSCILILVVIALRYLLRGRISLRLQYALWLLVLARLLLPVSFGSTDISVMSVVEKAPAVQAVESVRGVDTIWQADNGSVEGYPVGPLLPDTPVTVAPSVTNDQFGRMESALTLRKLLLPIWWCGAAVTLLVFLTANLRFAGRLRKSRRPLAVEGAALSVYVAEERAVPCLFGLFRPAIYVTQAAVDDPELLRHTVAHETTHFRHGDHVWALLRAVCLALHWWDPLVWWAAKLSRQDGELACDEATIRTLGESERAAYGRTLIHMACGQGASPLLTATTMDGGKTSLHERIVLLAKKPRTAVAAAIVVVLVAALCIACTFTGAKKDGAEADMGPIATMMAELTVDDVDDWDVTEYPEITLGRLVTAMNGAAAREITAEEAQKAERDSSAETRYLMLVNVEKGHDLSLSCGDTADIVHVTDMSAALSSAYDPEAQRTAYFRDHTLYELVRKSQKSYVTTKGRMESIQPEDLEEISPYTYPLVTAQQVIDALHGAAAKQITEGEAAAAGYPVGDLAMWRLETYLGALKMGCNLQENIVCVEFDGDDKGYFRDKTLYDLVRHSRDYDEFIDQASYEEFKPQIDAVMQQTLDNYATNPGKFTAYQLTRFTKVWQYATGDGNRADVYRFDYALMPEKPLEIGWAGGAYLDSQMRMQGFSDCGNVVARYRGDTLLGLVFMGNDNSYVPPFDEDWDWANGMLAAMEQAASAPTLTTETFSIHGLKVEVSNVCLTKKGTVREDESQVFENDVFVVYPGAVLTVLEAPTFRDTDGVEHGDFVYYSHGGAQRLELRPGMTVKIEGGSAIVDESFGVLVFQMYSGM